MRAAANMTLYCSRSADRRATAAWLISVLRCARRSSLPLNSQSLYAASYGATAPSAEAESAGARPAATGSQQTVHTTYSDTTTNGTDYHAHAQTPPIEEPTADVQVATCGSSKPFDGTSTYAREYTRKHADARQPARERQDAAAAHCPTTFTDKTIYRQDYGQGWEMLEGGNDDAVASMSSLVAADGQQHECASGHCPVFDPPPPRTIAGGQVPSGALPTAKHSTSRYGAAS